MVCTAATVVAVLPPGLAVAAVVPLTVVPGAPGVPATVVGTPLPNPRVESVLPSVVLVTLPAAVRSSLSAAPVTKPPVPTSASTAATAIKTTRRLAGSGVGSIVSMVDGRVRVLLVAAATTAPVRGWMKWFTQGLWKRRRVIFGWTALSVVVIGAAFARTYDWAGRPERSINDPGFERAAVKICEKEVPELRAVKREGDTDDPLEAETAAKVEDVADDLEAMVKRLRAIEVRTTDQPKVDAWFVAYADYIEAGRSYATALRGGNENEYNTVDDRAIEPLKKVRDFARANYIDACIP